MENPRTTLRDIAKVVGKSHVTVSLALRGHSKISEATRNRVLATARELGYRPDPLLCALAEHRKAKTPARFQASIGWINLLDERKISRHFKAFQLYHLGASRRAVELGYKLDEVHPIADVLSGKSLRGILQNRGISGFLVSPHFNPGFVWDFDATGFSGVSFGFSVKSPRLHVVTNSQAHSSALCVENLRRLGHEKIAFLVDRNVHERSAHNFVAGFLGSVLSADSMQPFPVLFYKESLEYSQWKEWFDAFRPDALIVGNSSELESIERSGLSIPGDLSVALLNVFPGDRRWAGIDQRWERTGEVAVDTLVALIHRNETGSPECVHHILVESVWKDGFSVRQRR